jgi:hypothetical protein
VLEFEAPPLVVVCRDDVGGSIGGVVVGGGVDRDVSLAL